MTQAGTFSHFVPDILDDTLNSGRWGARHKLGKLMQTRQTVAILGGGASGLTAIQIVSQGGCNGPRIYLVEKEDVWFWPSLLH